jgi:hypothetical protein
MTPTPKLDVPSQSRAQLEFCDATPEGISDWVANLSASNGVEASLRLYDGIVALNQLQCDPVKRFQMLEELRGPIYARSALLSGTYLEGPLALSTDGQQHADRVQALQNQLAIGYRIVVADSARAAAGHGLDSGALEQAMANAIHRAMSDIGRAILHSSQLYATPPKGLWLELHRMYRFAETEELLDMGVPDPHNRLTEVTSVGNAYLRALLLGCADTNTMRRDALTHLLHALEIWGSYVVLEPDDGNSLFVVDLEADAPPTYRVRENGERGDTSRSLDMHALVASLNAHLEGEEPAIPVPESITPEVARRAVRAWGGRTGRKFKRNPASGALDVCVGLKSAHYHVAGETDFGTLLGRTAADALNPFLRFTDSDPVGQSSARGRESDVESSNTEMAPDAEGERHPVGAYPCFTAQMVDTSPGGYCIRWSSEVPANLQVGELLAVREEGDLEWAIAVVRRIRNPSQEGVLTGIELLAPRAFAVGARAIRKKGGATDYLRALLLPEVHAIGQPAMLVTPKLPFQARQKVQINQDGDVLTARLAESTGGSASFNQFAFRLLAEAPLADDKDADDHNGLSIDFDH